MRAPATSVLQHFSHRYRNVTASDLQLMNYLQLLAVRVDSVDVV